MYLTKSLARRSKLTFVFSSTICGMKMARVVAKKEIRKLSRTARNEGPLKSRQCQFCTDTPPLCICKAEKEKSQS
jgi:hypothetical protein